MQSYGLNPYKQSRQFTKFNKSHFSKRSSAYGRNRTWPRGRNVWLRNARTGGLIGIEKKFLDIPLATTALTAAAGWTGAELPPTGVVTGCYSAPAQGDGAQNREGNKIVIVEINMAGVISVAQQTNATAADLSCVVFLALVQDTQTNAVQLNSEDVYNNFTGDAAANSAPFRNMSYTKRFKVLRVKKITLRIPAMTYDGTNIEQSGFHTPFNMKWKGKMPCTFLQASTTADIANCTDNSIQLVGIATNLDLAPRIIASTRMRFYG